MLQKSMLTKEERAVFTLRALYLEKGYKPFRMSKFEEYELYLRNKDFLVSDRVITFNDTDGRLLALKPDVTLSIVKNGKDVPGQVQKVFYNESVYRVSGQTRHFREIAQTGLEAIGQLTKEDIAEVILLAAQSLSQISKDFVLAVSSMDVLSALLKKVSPEESFRREALSLLKEKNSHDFLRLAGENEGDMDAARSIADLLRLSGNREEMLTALRPLLSGEELAAMESLSAALENSPLSPRIVFDFSALNDTAYYNGFALQGFVPGVSEKILAGGQYDLLMKKMGRRSRAIGFAIYLDLLEMLPEEEIQC